MLKLINISKTYKTEKSENVLALKNISLTFPERGIVFITGKSGSGKSTLLNIIGTLDIPDSGEIIVDNKSITNFTESDYDNYRNTYLGFVFQELNLLDDFSVQDNISLALQLQNQNKNDVRIDNVLKQVELEGYSNRLCNELSGGQRQRVAIARALIKTPSIIITDEPTGALDSKTGAAIFALLKKISNSCLVIVVSHDEKAAEEYGDHIIKLSDGNVVESTLNPIIDSTSQLNIAKAKMPLSFIFKFAFKNFNKKIKWFVLTMLLAAFSFTFFGILISASDYDKIEMVTKSLYQQNVKEIAVFKGAGENLKYLFNNQISLNDNDYKKLKNDFSDYEFLPIYNHSFTSGGLKIEITKELMQQKGLTLVAGRLPETDNEYAISLFEYDKINNEREEPFTDYNEILQGYLVGIIDTHVAEPVYDLTDNKELYTNLLNVRFVAPYSLSSVSRQNFISDIKLYKNASKIDDITLTQTPFTSFQGFDLLDDNTKVYYFDKNKQSLDGNEIVVPFSLYKDGNNSLSNLISKNIDTFVIENYEDIKDQFASDSDFPKTAVDIPVIFAIMMKININRNIIINIFLIILLMRLLSISMN